MQNGKKSVELYYNGSTIEFAVFYENECISDGLLETDNYPEILNQLSI